MQQVVTAPRDFLQPVRPPPTRVATDGGEHPYACSVKAERSFSPRSLTSTAHFSEPERRVRRAERVPQPLAARSGLQRSRSVDAERHASGDVPTADKGRSEEPVCGMMKKRSTTWRSRRYQPGERWGWEPARRHRCATCSRRSVPSIGSRESGWNCTQPKANCAVLSVSLMGRSTRLPLDAPEQELTIVWLTLHSPRTARDGRDPG